MIVRLANVSYTYPSRHEPALDDVSVDIEEGAFTLLAGASASGKSTFLRLLNGLVPQFHGGRLSGRIEVAGLDPSRTPARRMAQVAGMVFQEPEAQAIADSVEDEIAFGMEQHGIPPPEMRRRMDELLPALGIDHLRYRRLSTVSGGERQRVAIAAVLALEPRVLLLDEPTSQLDPAGAETVVALIRLLHQNGRLTIAVAEHRLERLLPVVNGVLVFEQGKARQLQPRDAAASLPGAPSVCRLGQLLGLDPVPLTVEEARTALQRNGHRPNVGARSTRAVHETTPGDELLRVEGLSVAYGELTALSEATLTLKEGEIVALVGENGSGKTTLFRAIAGLAPATSGAVSLNGGPAAPSVRDRTAFAGLVPQDPALALYRESVADEIAETLRNREPRHGNTPDARVALERWGIERLAARNPRDVSVGQQQRVAIAAMLAHEPRVWLLDEPTRGADVASKAWLANRMKEHAASGGAVIVATHDVESAAGFATRVVGLEAGRVAFDLPARRAFAADGPLPTQVAQLGPGALVPEEVEA